MLSQIDELSSELCKTELSNGYVIDFALRDNLKQRPTNGLLVPKTQRNGGSATSVAFIQNDMVTDFNIRIPGTNKSDVPTYRQIDPPCRVRVYSRLFSGEGVVHIKSTQPINPESFIDYLREIKEVN